MAVISCDACSGKMNSGLAVCPHCGARRVLTEKPKLSNDEIHALLATDPASRSSEPPRGLFQTLVLPHPATSGGTRVLELVLTGLGLPLVIAGVASIGVARRGTHQALAESGEIVPALAMSVFGGVGMLGHAPLLLVGAMVAALWARALVRTLAGATRSRDLLRIDRPPAARSAALPAARVVRDEPATAPKPELPAMAALPAIANPGLPAPPVLVTTPEPPSEPSAEPRLLR